MHVKGVVTDLEPVRWARKSESNMQAGSGGDGYRSVIVQRCMYDFALRSPDAIPYGSKVGVKVMQAERFFFCACLPDQVFRLVDTAGRAVRIVAWGDSNVDHPAIQDRQEVVLFYTVARKSPERSDESDGGLWLFASYILGVGACEEVPAVIELIAIT